MKEAEENVKKQKETLKLCSEVGNFRAVFKQCTLLEYRRNPRTPLMYQYEGFLE